jgi:4-amino-4-deoxy-L-arabinose transferase-like glycosyltransferase
MLARAWIGRTVMAVAVAAAIWAAVTAIAGGFVVDVLGVHVSSRDPVRPLAASLLLFITARLVLGPADFTRAIAVVVGAPGSRSARSALATALAVLVYATAWNTRAAGGSDSSCYILQADAFAHGEVSLAHPLSSRLSGAAPAVFAPTGFVPSRRPPFAAVPICGPGLALTMAPFIVLFGRDAVFFVVPIFAALAVWLTFVIGRRLDDDVTGVCAAVLVASSPIFLYQAVQPMSDVPAAALWLASLALLSRADARGQLAAGFCASLAVLMRPNIALIVLPLLALLSRACVARAPQTGTGAWIRFGLGALPGVVVMAALNAARYGSPLASGYGSTDALFSFAHVAPNMTRYPQWLIETETPFIALALLAPWWARRHPDRARLVMVSLAAIALTVATYLAYTVFDDWWYIRFLLPVLPLLMVLSVAVTLQSASWLPPLGGRSLRGVIAAGLCVALGGWHLHVARARHVFDLQNLESRFVVTGRYVARALPANAVFLAVQESGSLRYHGGRITIAWDAIAPGALDRTIAWLAANGFQPLIALEDAEEPRFRVRFASDRLGALDWPPMVEVHAAARVRIYDPAARAAFAAGSRIVTAHVR